MGPYKAKRVDAEPSGANYLANSLNSLPKARQNHKNLQNQIKIREIDAPAPVPKDFTARRSPFSSVLKDALPVSFKVEDLGKEPPPLMVPSPHTQYIVRRASLLDEVEFKAKQKHFLHLDHFLDDNVNDYITKIGYKNASRRKEEETQILCQDASLNRHSKMDNPLVGEIQE